MEIKYLSSHEQLLAAAQEWNSKSILGIDLECENNLHHYGSYLSLIQVSDGKKVWIVDVLMLGMVPSVVEMLQNAAIEKVFHDVSFDFRILSHQLQCVPRRVFDTQLAALFLGITELGLGSLLEQFFGIKKKQKFQMADWTKRPLSSEMLEYAAADAMYLPKLREFLAEQLQGKGRFSWVGEECAALEKKEWEYSEGDYTTLKGFSTLSPQQRAIVKRLFQERQKIAQMVDRPVHFVFSNAKLVEFSQHAPDWRKIERVHPIVRQKAAILERAVQEAKGERVEVPRPEWKHFTPVQKNKARQLEEVRNTVAVKLGLPKYLVLDAEEIREIVLKGSKEKLLPWQRKVLGM